ncbi:MAG TPA: acetamidase/formamidase family protein [Solirubrobacteraceae bacterium]|nr:acetamidase/formamidase family protein [Solirubrobacteraceae bacterium]
MIDPTRIHHHWDNRLEPTLRVEPGDVVHYDLKMAGDGQVEWGWSYAQSKLDFDTLYNLLGPVFVEGAEPGDTLAVEILSLRTGEWGWCGVQPDLGLLPEDFPDGFFRYFDLTQGDTTALGDGVRIPIEPFLGTMGNHPDDPVTAAPFPPHKGAGNVDTRHLKAGSTFLLPVFVPGALFSCGDPHAAQGDGEVCVAAIETAMQATLRFALHKRTISTPRFVVPGPLTPRVDAGGFYGTMGIDPDLMQGAKQAVRGMIELLGEEHGLSREDAYVLCSLTGDLKIMEIVDAGVWNVGLLLPRSIFSGGPV